MIAGHPPTCYRDCENEDDLYFKKEIFAIALPKDVSASVSQQCKSLLRILLKRDPNERADFNQFEKASNAFVALGCNGPPVVGASTTDLNISHIDPPFANFDPTSVSTSVEEEDSFGDQAETETTGDGGTNVDPPCGGGMNINKEFLQPHFVDHIKIETRFLWPLRYIKVTLKQKERVVAVASSGPIDSNNLMMERIDTQLREHYDDDGNRMPLRLKNEHKVYLWEQLGLDLDWALNIQLFHFFHNVSCV